MMGKDAIAQDNQLVNTNTHAATTSNILNINAMDFSALISSRADAAINAYIDTVESRVMRLDGKKGKPGYRRELQNTLQTRYVPTMNGKNAHCVFGQRLSFDAAMNALGMGDLSVFPKTDACRTLIGMMRQDNGDNSFYGTIWQNDSIMNVARNRARDKKEFDKNNATIAKLTAGSVISTNSHAEMILGRGQIVAGKFVADSTSNKIYAIGFNRETIREIGFRNGRLPTCVFIGDLREIIVEKITERQNEIMKMPYADLVKMAVSGGLISSAAVNISEQELRIMLLEKLFGVSLNKKYYLTPQMLNTLSRQREG